MSENSNPSSKEAKILQVDSRTIMQNANLAIRDVYDAIVELVTNADDRYQILRQNGRVEVELKRQKKQLSTLCVRDFADGMDSDTMQSKLGRIGGRVSGLEEGYFVRGTNSRGAKDVAALGDVTFESIASDELIHKCRINSFFEFSIDDPSPTTKNSRSRLGIVEGTGTVVTIELKSSVTIPRHKELAKKVGSLVQLRDIVQQKNTRIFIRDLQSKGSEVEVDYQSSKGKKCFAEKLVIPGYEKVDVKLTVFRAHKILRRENVRFRRGGILVKSKHAIHESTLFDSEIESDPNGLWFYGRLRCQYIDELWNKFDDRFDQRLEPLPDNPCPITDPNRKTGLTRSHPFVNALYREASNKLRILVEKEREREKIERKQIESQKTRKRLNLLQKAVDKFLEDEFPDDVEKKPTSSGNVVVGGLQKQGFSLSPPYAQLVVGQSINCNLNVLREAFPEIEIGDVVQIECFSSDIQVDKSTTFFDKHPKDTDVLRAGWNITALDKAHTTGVRVQCGRINGEIILEVLGSEAEKYSGIHSLVFQHRQYKIQSKKRKRVRLFAPLSLVDKIGRTFELEIIGNGVQVSCNNVLVTRKNLGIAVSELLVSVDTEASDKAKLVARLGNYVAETQILLIPSTIGVGIQIKLEDVDFGSARYRFVNNVIEIAAKHPSLKRYLGEKSKDYPGQEERHFRILLAEIVADAVCSEVLRRKIQATPEEYEDADWDLYYAEFSELLTKLLPTAHNLVDPNVPNI